MRQASVAGWTTLLAALVSAVVLILMLYRGLAEPEAGRCRVPRPPWMVHPHIGIRLPCGLHRLVAYSRFLRLSLEPVPEVARLTQSDGEVTEAPETEDAPEARDLSRLPEDERRLYEIIEAAGGEILQMKLVSSGEFSKSKVTRLLDKLENRELIKRERHGMTNMVRLVR